MWDLLFQVIGGALIGAAVGLAICYWQDIVDWFRNFTYQNPIDYDNCGVLLKEQISGGNYNLIQGVFNRRTNQYLEARRIEASQLDDDTKRFMYGKEIEILELYD